MAESVRTVAQRIRAKAAEDPRRVALRDKHLGYWRDTDRATAWDTAERIAHALIAGGIAPGDRIAIHADDRPEWLIADVAASAARAVSVGIYPTSPAAEVSYLLRDAGVRVLFAEDQEQVDKALAVIDEIPSLERIVCIDPRGIGNYGDPRLTTWDAFLAEGDRVRAADPDAVTARMDAATPDDLAVLIYTSGTTGPPKGVMLRVANIDFAIEIAKGAGGLIEPPLGSDDVILSYLPLSHVYERLLTCWLATDAGAIVCFGGAIDTLAADLRAVQPTIFASVPRVLEKMHAGVQVRMSAATRVKRWNYGAWAAAAAWMGRIRAARGGRHTAPTRIVAAVGSVFLYRALLDRLGLRKCRLAISGAAPIAPQILEWFMGIGVPIVEAWGMSETTAIGTANRLGAVQLGTVGTPLPGVELTLDPRTSEIRIRHDGIFVGYWNQPEATAAVLDPEGWLHTGDVGMWEGASLRIVDRLKDIIITAGGKNIAPSEIENALKISPFIKEAVIIGDARAYLTALIGIEADTVGAWAQSRGITYTTYADLTLKPEVRALVEGVVAEVNERFARVEQIKMFRLLPKELDEDEGELTATQKVKRRAVESSFASLIDEMYRVSA